MITPTNSLVYYALCELSDALDNLSDLKLRSDSPYPTSYLEGIISDIESSYRKLKDISL